MPNVPTGVSSWPCVLTGKRRQYKGEAQGKNQVLLHKPLIKGHFERHPVLAAGWSCGNPSAGHVQPAGVGSNKSSSGFFVSGPVV